MAFPLLAVAVVQITNGCFFAAPPYSFSRPIYPEANILYAGLSKGDYSYIVSRDRDAVSWTISNGGVFDDKLKIDFKAFSDSAPRHENLLWLSEVSGERYACYKTAVGDYEPVTGIDRNLVNKYAALLSDTALGTSVNLYVSVTNALFLMKESSESSYSRAKDAENMLAQCTNYMGIVSTLANTQGAWHEAAATNHEAIAKASEAIAAMSEAASLSDLAGHYALTITNAVLSAANIIDRASVTNDLLSFISNSVTASSFSSFSTNMATMAKAYCEASQSIMDEQPQSQETKDSVSLNSVLAAESFSSAISYIGDFVGAVSMMADLSRSIDTNLYDTAYGLGGYYIRTPAYFCCHESESDLYDVIGVSSNLFSRIADFGEEIGEIDSEEVESDEKFLAMFGIGPNGLSLSAFPSRFKPFTASPFVNGAEALTGYVQSGAVMFPLEDRVCTNGNVISISSQEASRNADYTGDTYVYSQIPSNAFLVCPWRDLNSDYYVYACTNDVPEPEAETNVVWEITPERPIGYRQLSYRLTEQLSMWTTWSMTGTLTPFLALVVNGGDPFMMFRKDESAYMLRPDSPHWSDTWEFTMFDVDVLTRGVNMPVSTIACIEIPPTHMTPRYYYFRTNAYSLAVSRAVGLDGMVHLGENDTLSFSSLLADVSIESYYINYSGWDDWTSSGGHASHSHEGYSLRTLVPIRLWTRFPEDGKFRFAISNIYETVCEVLKSRLCEKYEADFPDMSSAYEKPPYMNGTTGGGAYLSNYSATRNFSVNFSIENLYVAANLNFTQGTTNSVMDIYQVPGYKHLDTPPYPTASDNNGWIGPYEENSEIFSVFAQYRQAYAELYESQTNRVPGELIEKVRIYELGRIKGSVDFID